MNKKKFIPEDYIECRFGKLTVNKVLPSVNGQSRVECQCDCGNISQTSLAHLRSGDSKSCGNCRKILKCRGFCIYITQNNRTFIFDPEDLNLIESYSWYVDSLGYVKTRDRKSGKGVQLHRLLTDNPNADVDHINGDPTDNRRINLRICSHMNNRRNSKLNSNNTSGYKGVSYLKRRKKYQAAIKVNYKKIHLGYFDDPIEAAKAYDKAAAFYFGEFARPNFPRKEDEKNGREKEQTLLEMENPLVYQRSWRTSPGANALP